MKSKQLQYSILLLFFFLAGLLAEEKEKIWRSLSGPFYRPGYWWTIKWDMEKNFPGSYQKVEASCGKWKVIHSGKETSTATLLGYYPLRSSMILLNIELFSEQDKKALAREYLTLIALKPEDILLGFYKSEAVERHFQEYKEALSIPIYMQKIDFIPGVWEGMNSFHFLALGESDIGETQTQALCHWVNAGGILWTTQEKFQESPYLSKLLHTAHKQAYQDIEIWEIGWGLVLLVPAKHEAASSQTIYKEIIPFLLSKFSPKKDYAPKNPPILFLPAQWGNAILYILWAICSVNLFLFWLLKKKSSKTYKAILSTLFSLIGIVYLFWYFLPVSYQEFSITQVLSGKNIAIEHSYIQTQKLGRTLPEIFFATLPLPVGTEENSIEIKPYKQGWQIFSFSPKDAILWYSRKVFSFPGFFQAEKKQEDILFLNQTSMELEDMLYLGKDTYHPLNAERHIQTLSEPISFWNTSQLPSSWKQNNLLPWLSRIFSTPFIASYSKNFHTTNPNFAFYHKTKLVCIFLHSK